MAHLFRPIVVKPVPRSATLGKLDGRPVARWTARGGRAIVAPLTTDGTRCRVTSPTWWVEYTDAHGTRRKSAGFRDRSATMALAARLEEQARDARAGVERPDRDGQLHLTNHVPTFLASLRRKGDSVKHVATIDRQLRAACKGASLTTPATVDRDAVERWLDGEAKRLDWGTRTRNQWAGTLHQFGRWLVRERHARANPFDGLARGNVERDRRYVRRVLDPGDLDRLIRAAHESTQKVRGLTGPDRAMLYAVASLTGRRLGALRKMTAANVVWEGSTPVAITTSARIQKSGKAHTVPIHPEFAADLAAWLASKPASGPLWSGWANWSDRGADLVKHDLAIAREAWISEAGKDKAERARREASDRMRYRDAAGEVADFHSLRGSFITSLAVAGVPLTAAQALADHSDPKLTANVYTKWANQLAGEVAKLPGLGVRLVAGSPSVGGSVGVPRETLCPQAGTPETNPTSRRTKKPRGNI